ncbi:MAG: hypothetical protein FWG68_05525 [Defluviitaleaceae bacterium]|nr:hypothetical protein [Defluviitaleaceae bacterium]
MLDSKTIVNFILPRLIKISVNILTRGPAILVRATTTVLRANMITRVVAAISLSFYDIWDYRRGNISKPQFIRNVLMSWLMVLFGTVGWYFGAEWILIEIIVVGFEVLAGGFIGMGIFMVVFNALFSAIMDKFLSSDSQRMLGIIRNYTQDTKLIKKIKPADLKKMYAAKNKDIFALQLVKKYQEL